MTETYTAEDFENAEFARHYNGRVAARHPGGWFFEGALSRKQFGPVGSNYMASAGWVPVFTSAAGNDRRVERLKRQVTEQDITICRRNRQIEELRELVKELGATTAPSPVATMGDLWATAEVPAMRTPIREGDWIIFPHDGGYPVRRVGREDMDNQDPWASEVRVLERAPEPWRAIADAMPSSWPEEVREQAAKTLHEAGAKMGEK